MSTPGPVKSRKDYAYSELHQLLSQTQSGKTEFLFQDQVLLSHVLREITIEELIHVHPNGTNLLWVLAKLTSKGCYLWYGQSIWPRIKSKLERHHLRYIASVDPRHGENLLANLYKGVLLSKSFAKEFLEVLEKYDPRYIIQDCFPAAEATEKFDVNALYNFIEKRERFPTICDKFLDSLSVEHITHHPSIGLHANQSLLMRLLQSQQIPLMTVFHIFVEKIQR